MNHNCPNCQECAERVIYFGLPGLFFEHCCCLSGLASYAQPLATEDENGELGFKFLYYEGSYWRALWCWLTGQ